jgi:hypothetical protein
MLIVWSWILTFCLTWIIQSLYYALLSSDSADRGRSIIRVTFCQEISLVLVISRYWMTRKYEKSTSWKKQKLQAQVARSFFCLTGPTVNILATGQRLRRTLIGLAIFLASTFLSFYPCSFSNIVTDNKLRAIWNWCKIPNNFTFWKEGG